MDEQETSRPAIEAPTVSVIVPCRNEALRIGGLLAALAAQRYDLARVEIIIADGGSTDGTHRAIDVACAQYPMLDIQVLDNPNTSIPAALNLALAAARGTYIVRMDAHSAPHPEYLARCISLLEAGRGANVGGVWQIAPGAETLIARGIAAAAGSPLAVGDAKYRYTSQAGPVDTVPFGAFRRDLALRLAGYDETLLANEDYEFNVRIRWNGGTIWLDPQIRATYYARPTLRALARQYWRYGFWKQHMLRRNPETLRPRQVAAPTLVATLSVLSLLAPFARIARWLLALVLALYAGLLALAAGGAARKERKPALLVVVPPAVATMHLAWGSGFLAGMLGGRAAGRR